ncbi:putative non-specific serine/threonine protein kinase [Helianthus annuus]|nr:putative non-specific serine/threonine protein kinase [Helianthus annuus]
MEINIPFVIFTFLFFQTLALSGNTITTSSNVTCIERERHSLLVFKQSTDAYNLLSTWSGAECCEWQGIWCDSRNGHVVELELHNKSLQGNLSHSLHNLKHLRHLDLSVNSFSGNIPKFLGLFQHLKYLNLSRSGFSGVVPHQLGNLSRLQYLDLSVSSSGTLFMNDMGWVSSLSSLRYFDLTAVAICKDINWFHPVNMLSSLLKLNLAYANISLPSIEFVNFTSLNSLDLSRNKINSTIPMWLSNLTGLMHLDLNHNHFHGKIPDSVRMPSALAYVDLSYNSFDNLTADLLCNMRNLPHSSGPFENMFYGPIPQSLGLLSSLEDLYLDYNQLSGNIPTGLGQLSKLRNLFLSNNSLVGVLSEVHFTKLKNLNHLDLNRNSLGFNFSSGWIPPFQLRIFFAHSCNIGPHFPYWLQTQINLQRLDISNSSIRDTIPEWFENILSGIIFLDLSNNQIGGKLPKLDDGSIQSSLGILRMNSNKLEGSLATFPSNLYVLDLSDNLLWGYGPQTDGTLNPGLEVLNLSNNRFTGNIPIQFCKYPRLSLLDLSPNKFSGRLPECLGNLIHLEVLDLSNNILTGVVPSSLGSLQDLSSLHLHNNRFEGNIPESLQNLRALNTMDLGNNLFVGTIPFWIG